MPALLSFCTTPLPQVGLGLGSVLWLVFMQCGAKTDETAKCSWITHTVTRARTHLEPVPIRYVLVPCRVCGPGLQPNMRMTRDDNCSIRGIMVFAITVYGLQ